MELESRYDQEKAKHFVEGIHMVLHCHHFNTLLHRAMVNTPFFDGADFVYRVSRDDFYGTLNTIFKRKNISGEDAIKREAVFFYRSAGFGNIDPAGLERTGGRVISPHSHLATGYKNKWGEQESPVDDFGRGFVAALWALTYDRKPEECRVTQTKCISCGNDVCEFLVEV